MSGRTDKTSSGATKLAYQAAESGVQLFTNPTDDRGYATIPVRDHLETYAIHSRAFRDWLANLYFDRFRGAAPRDAMTGVVDLLEAKARFEGKREQVWVRVARADDAIWIDRGDPDWTAIRVDSTGWTIVPSPPVRFRRPSGYGELPEPASALRSVRTDRTLDDELGEFVNAKGDALRLIAGWLVGALNPSIPYPILVLTGEQGSAKSTTSRFLRTLLDPSASPLRSLPRDERDLAIAGSAGWVLAFDNVSGVRDWISDALCRIATGGSIATRRLFTDDEEARFELRRPIILNGISDVGSRSDLLDRSLVVELDRIPDERRLSEREVYATFEQARPRLLGWLLAAISQALRDEGQVRLERAPRMADFARWVQAAEPTIGWTPGTFVAAYRSNRDAAHAITLDESPLVEPLKRLVVGTEWTGTTTDLLARLAAMVDERTSRSLDWPKSARRLGDDLRRLAPNLRTLGIELEHRRGGHNRDRLLRIVGAHSSVSSAGSAPSFVHPDEADGADAPAPTQRVDQTSLEQQEIPA